MSSGKQNAGGGDQKASTGGASGSFGASGFAFGAGLSAPSFNFQSSSDMSIKPFGSAAMPVVQAQYADVEGAGTVLDEI